MTAVTSRSVASLQPSAAICSQDEPRFLTVTRNIFTQLAAARDSCDRQEEEDSHAVQEDGQHQQPQRTHRPQQEVAFSTARGVHGPFLHKGRSLGKSGCERRRLWANCFEGRREDAASEKPGAAGEDVRRWWTTRNAIDEAVTGLPLRHLLLLPFTLFLQSLPGDPPFSEKKSLVLLNTKS